MARKPKPGGRLNKGPFTASDFERALGLDGWERIKGKTRHPAFKHPAKPGKVNYGTNWSGVMYGHQTFEGVAAQAGLTKRQLLQLLNQ